MRPLMIAAPLAAALLLAMPDGALAQANPSADQIINSLKPGSGMGAVTRGIRPIGPAGPVPPVSHGSHARHAAAAAANPGAGEAAPSVSLTIDFATNSADLTPDAVHALDQLGKALSSATLAHYRFRIEGHTDTVGSPAANQALSEQRAQAVAAYIEKYFSVPASRLQPVGMGSRGLAVPTPPQTAEARNRRVQVVNLGT
jgi:outer membrane protein OmpA-like peptidoglycan-associated protein